MADQMKQRLVNAGLLDWAWAIDTHLHFHRAYEASLIDNGFTPERIAWFRREFSLTGAQNAKLAPKDQEMRSEVGQRVSDVWNNAEIGRSVNPQSAWHLITDTVAATKEAIAAHGGGPNLTIAVVKALSFRSLKPGAAKFSFPMFDKQSCLALKEFLNMNHEIPPARFLSVFHEQFVEKGQRHLAEAEKIMGRRAVQPLRAMDKFLWLRGAGAKKEILIDLYNPGATP